MIPLQNLGDNKSPETLQNDFEESNLYFIPILKLHLKLGAYFSFFPYRWDESEYKLLLSNPKTIKSRVQKRTALKLIYNFSQFVNIFFGNYSLAERLIGGLFAQVIMAGNAICWDWSVSAEPVQFFNALVDYEKKHKEGKSKFNF